MVNRVPPAGTRAGDVALQVVDEHGRRGIEPEATLRLVIDGSRGLDRADAERRDGSVPDTLDPVGRVEMPPVQVAHVRQQVHPILAHERAREIEHLVGALEHVEPPAPELVRIQRLRRRCGDATQQFLPVNFAPLVCVEVDTRQPPRQVRKIHARVLQVADEGLVAKPQQHPTDVEYHVPDHGWGRQPRVRRRTANPTT